MFLRPHTLNRLPLALGSRILTRNTPTSPLSTLTLFRSHSTNTTTVRNEPSMMDEEQLKYMHEENCILVDEQDRAMGHASKEFCHQLSNIDAGDNRALHRAFSVFLFNNENKLLLQQRASDKITFPLLWTNTCCSHPLHDIEAERPGLQDVLEGDRDWTKLGVMHAAVRKMEHELGIAPDSLPLERFVFMNRILYSAPCDDTWGEHEVDYCLVYQHPGTGTANDLPMAINRNEVEAVKFVSAEELKSMMQDSSLKFTPWFKIICDKFLFTWWDSMIKGENLDKHRDTATVHKM